MHKTADFHSNLLVSWELVTEGCQVRTGHGSSLVVYFYKATPFYLLHHISKCSDLEIMKINIEPASKTWTCLLVLSVNFFMSVT